MGSARGTLARFRTAPRDHSSSQCLGRLEFHRDGTEVDEASLGLCRDRADGCSAGFRPHLVNPLATNAVGCSGGCSRRWHRTVARQHALRRAYHVDAAKLALHPYEGIRRCDPTNVWEVELVTDELVETFGN